MTFGTPKCNAALVYAGGVRISMALVALAACSSQPLAGRDASDALVGDAAAGLDVRSDAVVSLDADVGASKNDAEPVTTDGSAPDAFEVDAGVADLGFFDAAPTPTDAAETPDLDASVTDSGEPSVALCTQGYQRPVGIGTVTEPKLDEISGIVPSSTPGVVWVHEDSGGQAAFYALRDDGTLLGRFDLQGASVRDMEDIAMGPCPDRAGSCVWLADTGDNDANRIDVKLFAIPEPIVDPSMPVGVVELTDFKTLPIAYPSGPMDVEALVVSRQNGALYLFEKVDGPTTRILAYDPPFVPNVLTTLRSAGSFSSPGVPIQLGRMVTAADWHPSGERVLIRVYTGIFEYELGPNQTPENLSSATRTALPFSLEERQGEAVAYDHSGMNVISVAEGSNQVIHLMACR